MPQANVESQCRPLTLSRRVKIPPTPAHLLHLQLSLQLFAMITILVPRAPLAAVSMNMASIALLGDAARLKAPPAVMTITVAAPTIIRFVTFTLAPA